MLIKTLTKWSLAKTGTLRKPQEQYRTKRGISSPVVYGIVKPGEPGYFVNDTMLKGERLSQSVLYALTLGKLDFVNPPCFDFYGKTVVCINKNFPNIDEIIASVVPERVRFREKYLKLFEYNGETCYAFQVKDLSITVSDMASQLLTIVRGLEIPNVKSGRIHHLHDVIVSTEDNDKNWCYSSDEIFKILSNNGIHIINCEYEPDEKSCTLRQYGIESDYLDYCPINKSRHYSPLLISLELLTHNILFEGREVGRNGHAPEPYINRYNKLTEILNDRLRGVCLSDFIFLSCYKTVMEKAELYKAFIKLLIRKDLRENWDMRWFMQAMEHYVDNPLEPLPKSLYEEAECIDRANSY